MRTLVIGIPLPHPTFDNYSFVSAPALSDYQQMVLEMAAVSRVVDEAAAGSNEHRTYAGQPVVDGPTTVDAFGLADLLAMRRREAERFLARGGVMACFAHPDVSHPRLQSQPGWKRYSWLPAPEEFRFEEHLLPGFGKLGVTVADSGHAFAPYVEGFGPRLAYRAEVDERAPGFESYGRVFSRSLGGAAVGVELRVGPGRIVLLPPLSRFEEERPAVATVLFECFERCRGEGEPQTPEWMRKDLS